jgi:thioester reductase-like protein
MSSAQIDWAEECRLGFEPGPGDPAEARTRTPRTALLTGATGFLGGFLLRDLLDRTSLERIVCFVRCSDEAEGRARLESHYAHEGQPLDPSRVEVVPSDLAAADLGLAPGQFDDLASRVDVIYHNAAQIHLAHRYGRLKGPNVEGTRGMLRLAFAGGRWKPFHHASSIAVVTSAPYVEREEALETDRPVDLDTLEGGYPQSKAVAEELVRAASALGLPTTIHRLGLLIGHSRTGAWTMEDFVPNLMRAWIHSGVSFDLGGPLDLTTVDYVSRALVEISQRPEALGRTFHLVNVNPPDAAELADAFTNAGCPVEIRSLADWRAAVGEVAERMGDFRLAATLMLFPAGTEGGPVPRFPVVHRVRFDDHDARALLEPVGICCPRVDAELVAKYIRFIRDTNQL